MKAKSTAGFRKHKKPPSPKEGRDTKAEHVVMCYDVMMEIMLLQQIEQKKWNRMLEMVERHGSGD